MKFTYFNDTERKVTIHPGTFIRGCEGSDLPIKPLEERTFILPENTYAYLKMWDYGPELGLQILIIPRSDSE
ncbi:MULTISPECIES: hypothetical protein [Allobacillus]|uniref:Uncharacterized protein n=1 Tax=Allobacillus salarius TaxID=1955272 RepID=A0A556PDL7_9BACI|nr:hypothetical protein [Allobacillus salarius]TSJ62496.1 hypothetical protein FPQ13_09890 [Allobacillus salarius]